MRTRARTMLGFLVLLAILGCAGRQINVDDPWKALVASKMLYHQLRVEYLVQFEKADSTTKTYLMVKVDPKFKDAKEALGLWETALIGGLSPVKPAGEFGEAIKILQGASTNEWRLQ